MSCISNKNFHDLKRTLYPEGARMQISDQRFEEISELIEARNRRLAGPEAPTTEDDASSTFLDLSQDEGDIEVWNRVAEELGITSPELRAWFNRSKMGARLQEECELAEDHTKTSDDLLDMEEHRHQDEGKKFG